MDAGVFEQFSHQGGPEQDWLSPGRPDRPQEGALQHYYCNVTALLSLCGSLIKCRVMVCSETHSSHVLVGFAAALMNARGLYNKVT